MKKIKKMFSGMVESIKEKINSIKEQALSKIYASRKIPLWILWKCEKFLLQLFNFEDIFNVKYEAADFTKFILKTLRNVESIIKQSVKIRIKIQEFIKKNILNIIEKQLKLLNK